MKRILTIILILTTVKVFGQTDQNGNPIFNSVTLKQEKVNDFELVSNYYTIKNNIDNKTSSVFVSKKPTLKQVENASINLPSDFFLITKDQNVLNLILLQNYPKRQFVVMNPQTGTSNQYNSNLIGDITENRAMELLKEKYDSKAKIDKEQLTFNGKTFKIIPNSEIFKAVIKLINENNLSTNTNSNVKLLTTDQLKEIVLSESKKGGKLDFFTEIKGHEYDGVQIKQGVFSTKLGIALYKWGRANFELGVNSVEDALSFWKEHKGREANQREIDYIKLGFNKELEK